MRKLAVILILLIAAPLAVFSQNPATWKMSVSTGEAKLQAGEKFEAKLKAAIEPGWHLYALDQPPGGPIPTTIKVAQGWPFEVSGEIRAPEPKVAADNNFIVDGKPLSTRFFTDAVEFTVPVKAVENASGGDLHLDVRYQLCNDTVCLPPKTVRVSLIGSEDVKRTSGSSAAAAAVPPLAVV
jgi:thiol:disulfide interchange protein DsbD